MTSKEKKRSEPDDDAAAKEARKKAKKAKKAEQAAAAKDAEQVVEEAAPSEEPPSRRVYVGRCPPSLDEATLRATFAPCGALSDVLMVVEKKQFKGTCFVTFEEAASVAAALALDGTELKGSKLSVRVATPKPAKLPRAERPAAVAVAELHAKIAKKAPAGGLSSTRGEGGSEGATATIKPKPKKRKHGNRSGHSARPAVVRKRSDAAITKAKESHGKILY
tara:strand:- start:3263 stop:3925 length:663 start_codon:yes stop_codon:yes gene_type:complete